MSAQEELPEQRIRRLRGHDPDPPTARKVLMTIPAAALGTPEDVQVLVWDWSSGPVEVDIRTPAEESVMWTPLSLIGGHCGRVS